jgi:hypothetical protein
MRFKLLSIDRPVGGTLQLAAGLSFDRNELGKLRPVAVLQLGRVLFQSGWVQWSLTSKSAMEFVTGIRDHPW